MSRRLGTASARAALEMSSALSRAAAIAYQHDVSRRTAHELLDALFDRLERAHPGLEQLALKVRR